MAERETSKRNEQIEVIHKHLEEQIKNGGKPQVERLFNFNKNAKEAPPLSGFVEYYAYKTESRKHAIRVAQNEQEKNHGPTEDNPFAPTAKNYKSLDVFKTFK